MKCRVYYAIFFSSSLWYTQLFYLCNGSYTAVEGLKLSSEKLQGLGWKYRPLEETLVDAVKSFQENGFLPKH